MELSNQSLSKNLRDIKVSTQNEILALNERIESLNDENDQLHMRLAGADTTTQTHIETSKDISTKLVDDSSEVDEDTTEFDSILKELQPCDIPDSNPANPQLKLIP